MTLGEAIKQIQPPDPVSLERVQSRLDKLTKPLGSLGRLEELAARYVAMTGEEHPKQPRAAIFTFAADHGVTDEGISAYPRAVTAEMVLNFLRGGAAVNVLAGHVGAEVRVVDIGVAYEFDHLPQLISRKVAHGTKNFFREPAMTREEAVQALEIGVSLASGAASEGIGPMSRTG